MTLEERVSRLEAQQDLVRKADLTAVHLDISREIASLAGGIGGDLRDIRQDITGLRGDIHEIRRELAGIREVLERRAFHWPWERAS